MADEKEPSAPYGEGGGSASSKPKTPSTGEPSAPYGESGAGTSGGIPADQEQDPSQQPT